MAVVDATTHAGGTRHPRSALARNVVLLTGSQLATWGATLLWSLVIPRAIGPTQMGVYTLGVASGGVLTVLIGLGMRPLLVREIAADHGRAAQLVGTSITLRALIAAPVLGAVLLIARLGHFGHDEALALSLGWGMCIFYLFYEPIQAAFQAVERMQYLAYTEVLTKGAVSVGAIALVVIGVQAIGLLLFSILVMALVLALNLFWMRRQLRVDWRVTRTRLSGLFSDSLPYWSFAAFFTIYLWIDSLMLGVMTSSRVLGWYGLPTKLFGTLMFVPVILSTAWLPQLVRAFQGGTEQLYRAARSSLELALILSLPVSAGTVLVAQPLIHTLYGSDYAGSVPVLIVLALCVPPMYLNTMVNQVLIASKRQAVWTKVMVLACLVNPLFNLVLIPYFQRTQGNGATGAAISLLLTELVLVGIGIAMIRRAFVRETVMRLAKATLATAGMAGVVVLALPAGLAAGILAGAVSFPLFAALLRVLSHEERDQLRSVLIRVGQRLRPSRSGGDAE